MDSLPDQSIDMILCDLPYGTTKCSWDIIIPFDELWKRYNRICTPSAAILLFGTEPFSSSLRLSNIKDYRYDWYWNKGRAANFLFMNKQPGKIIETTGL
jgi:site-specific DNA-methyltransferase (adenine-specific)